MSSRRLAAVVLTNLTALFGLSVFGVGSTVFGQGATPAAAAACDAAPPVVGPAAFAMEEPTCQLGAASRVVQSSAGSSPILASYSHTPTPDSSQNLPPGSGPIMPSTTIYYDFWLPTGDNYGSNTANFENVLEQWAKDVGGSQYHNLVTQYSGTNGTVSDSVSFGGAWVDTAAYPHAGTTGDPLQDSDIQTEVHNAVTTNGWTEDLNHIVAVFTANGIQECDSSMSSCTYSSSNGYCAYHNHFTDGSNDAIYGFLGFDNFTHVAGKTCVAGQTSGDNDPNRSNYPNGVDADAEVNTLSHEMTEAETDPHPNATWTGPNGEIGDACNFNFSPRNDLGADVYLNGHPYIVQQEWSNAASTCTIDLPTNGFCAGSVSGGDCSPTTQFSKAVDNPNPQVNSTIHYTLSLDNTSDSAAETNLTVTDSLPTGYTVTGVSAPSSTSSSSTSSSVTVGYDTLAVHQTRSVVVTATVPVQAGTAATNCADLSGSDLLGNAVSDQTTSPCAATTPVKIPTTVTYNGPSSDDYNDPATVSATLADDVGNLLVGKSITFTLNGAETCSALTDPSGTATCAITPGEAAGPYTITAAFTDTTDPVYATSSSSVPFTVTLEETTTTYTGPTVILAGGSGVTLSGRLLEDGTTPIAGRKLTLGIGTQTCNGTTDASGNAHCTVVFTGALGPEPVSASFAGDAYYLPSADNSKTATTFAFPSTGAFALGDKTAAAATPSTTLTWWGDTWNQLNSLSGGTAPASFKGFVATVSLPTSTPPMSCAGNWTTGPGNSPPPAAGVPSYMGVLVTSNVTKNGNTISGNTVHIVVMKVNPGYQPSPSNHGTGTIVATFC